MSPIAARINAYEKLMRLDRPIGILLLLWPTLWALWLAHRAVPPFPVFLIFLTGTALMRSGGCAVNDFADREFDAKVERTSTDSSPAIAESSAAHAREPCGYGWAWMTTIISAATR